jgi:hypothetical protein
MKAFFSMVALSLLLVPLTGCETLTETPSENFARMAHTIDTNGKQIPNDVQRHLLLDRPSFLAREPVPNE